MFCTASVMLRCGGCKLLVQAEQLPKNREATIAIASRKVKHLVAAKGVSTA
jgi:hypothetical protein